jgi:hypothetical protein
MHASAADLIALLAETRGHLEADRILLLDEHCPGRLADGEPDRATLAAHATEAVDELDNLISRIDAAIGRPAMAAEAPRHG